MFENESSANAIFYEDATTWTGIADLKTRCYSGSVTTQATAWPWIGKFDETGNNQEFRGTNATNAAFMPTTLVNKYFFGPIDTVKDNSGVLHSTMLITTLDQIRDSK